MGTPTTWGGVPATVRTGLRVRAAWSSAAVWLRVGFVAALVCSTLLPFALWWSRSFVRAVVDVTTVAAVGSGVAGAMLAVAALVDLHEHRLPTVLLTGAMGSVVVGVGCHASIAADPALVLRSALGAALCGGVMLAVWCARGIGMGDVKMAAVVGAAAAPFGVTVALAALAVGAAGAGTWGLVARRQVLPLGPFLWFGWAAASHASVWWS